MKPTLTAIVLGLALILAAVSTVKAKTSEPRGEKVTPATLIGE